MIFSSCFTYHMTLEVQLSRIQRPLHFWQLRRSKVFPVWFYSRPNKELCKSRSFLPWLFTPTTTVIFIPLDKFSCVQRATNVMGGGLVVRVLYVLLSQDTTLLIPLSFRLSTLPLNIHSNNYSHFPFSFYIHWQNNLSSF